MARPTGLEPAPSRSTIESSVHLSYSRACAVSGDIFSRGPEPSGPELRPQQSKVLVGVEGFEPSVLSERRGYGPAGQPVAPTHPQPGGEGASRTRKSRRNAPLQTESACHMPNLSKTVGGSGASRTRKPRRYVPPRTGWAFHMPNATVAAGAGLEPAHALRREPRFQRGAMPFRSSCRAQT